MRIHLFLFLLINCCSQFSSYAQPAGENLAMTEAKFIPLEKTIYYKIGDSKTIPIRIAQYGPANTVFCFNMHDNEFTAVQAARSVLELQGGTLLRIENGAQRLIKFKLKGIGYAFDPNRIFSREGISQSLKENGPVNSAAVDAVEQFGQRLLQLIPDSIQCIIALHNNTEGAYSVKSYLPGGNRTTDAREVSPVASQDADDIVFTTDQSIYEQMAAAGFNAILQHNEKVKQDGSLSVYCGNIKRSYVNIETEHGKLSQYRVMLEKLLEVLSATNKKSPPVNGEDSL